MLEVIEVATTQLSGENYPTMFLVLPLVFGLHNQLPENDTDRGDVVLFKKSLCAQLTSSHCLFLSCALPWILTSAPYHSWCWLIVKR